MKPLILKGFKKEVKKISTRGLTVLTNSVILALEQITKNLNLEMEGFYEHQ